MLITPSEHARHARAELDTIIASLQLGELAVMLELGRKLLEQAEDRRELAPTRPAPVLGPGWRGRS